jgi:hypothetical protein
MKNKTNLMIVLVLHICIKTTLSVKYAYHKDKTNKFRFFSQIKGKEWAKVKFSDGNFSIKPFTNFNALKDLPNDTPIPKKYGVYYLSKYTGWLVFKTRQVYERTIQHGDYVVYVRNGISNILVDEVVFTEPKSKSTIMDYFRGDGGQPRSESQTNTKLKGYLNWVNNLAFQDPSRRLMSGIYMKKYLYDSNPNDLEDFVFGNQQILESIKADLKIENILKLKDDVQEYKTLVNGNDQDKIRYMSGLVKEITDIIQCQQEWNAETDDIFKRNVGTKLTEVINKMIPGCLTHLQELPISMNQNQFSINFQNWFLSFKVNWLFQRKVVNNMYIDEMNINLKTNIKGAVTYFKHHLATIIYTIIKKSNPIPDEPKWDASAFVSELTSAISSNTDSQKQLMERTAFLLEDLTVRNFSGSWLNCHFWVSQIENIDKILETYIEKITQFKAFKEVFSDGVMTLKGIHGLIDLFFLDGKNNRPDNKFMPVFDEVSRNLLLV